MARIGRSITPMSRLGRPVYVFAPGPPTQQQQTITTLFAAAVGDRRRMPRRFPLQGWDGDEIRQTQQGVTLTFGAVARTLGPAPPQIILPLPTLRMQTLTVTLGVVQNRLGIDHRYPLQGFDGVAVKGLGYTTVAAGSLIQRVVGPEPPAVVLPLPTLQMQTIATNIVARTVRFALGQRPARSKLSPPAVVEPSLLGSDIRLLIQTHLIAVAQRIAATRRQPHFQLFPALLYALPPPKIVAWAESVFRSRYTQARGTHSVLAPPAAVEPRLQMPDRRLYIQVDVQPVPTRQSLPRRRPFSRIYPPATLEPESVALHERQISVALAGRTRIELARRAPHYQLFPGIAEPRLTMPDRRLYVQVDLQSLATRASMVRRQPLSRLSPPATLEPESVAIHERQITVVLAGRTRSETGRRASRYALRPGVSEPSLQMPDRRLFVAVESQALATRASLIRRGPFSRLYPPATLEPESVQIAERTIRVVLAGRTRAEAVRRVPRYALRPPAVVEPYLRAPDRRLRVAVTLAGRSRSELARRTGRHVLLPGVSEPSLTIPDRRLLVQVDTQALPMRASMARRAPFSRLYPPATLAAATIPPVVTTTLVKFAGRTRLETQRRAAHSRLYPPTVVEPSLRMPDRRLFIQVDTQAIWTRTDARRRAPHSVFVTPSTLEPESVALTEREIAVRLTPSAKQPRRTHWLLSPPATLEPAAVALRERTIDTLLVAIPTRQSLARRGPHSVLSPPATLQPESVELRQQTITVALAGRTRVETQRRASHYRLYPGIAEPALRAPDRRLTIPTPFAPQPRQPRRTHSLYRGPVSYPATSTLAVALAGRTRVEVRRRAAHYSLGEPTTLQTFSGPGVTTAALRPRAEAARRAPHSRLAAPAAVTPATPASPLRVLYQAAVVARNALRRRTPRFFLRAPTVILPLSTLQQEMPTILTWAAVQDRLTRRRRAPHSHLYPPAVVQPFTVVTWRLSPEQNWLLTPAPSNDWRATPEPGWQTTAADSGWEIEPISGWTMEPDLP